jgi:SAM-dependent methyltransferase
MTSFEDKTRQRYQGAPGQQYHQAKRSIPDCAFPWVARWRAAKIGPQVRAGDTVLEYGVGLGWNLAALVCQRKLGFDIGTFLSDAVRQRGIEFIAEINQVPDGSIDVVVCHHTLEHALHPAEVLATIHRLLRRGGRLLLFVPYEKESRFWEFDPAEPNHHLYSWNVQTLGNLAQETGFTVQLAELGAFGQERFAAVWAARLHLGEPGFRMLRWCANSLKHELEVRVFAVKE